MKLSPCHINKQDMSQSISDFWPPNGHEGSWNCCHTPPPWWLLRSWENAESNRNKETRLAPDSWGAYERNEFSEPRGLHLPYTQNTKFLNLTPDLSVKTACSFCCNLGYSRTSSCLLLERFFRAIETLLPDSRVLNILLNKKKLLLLGCECIFLVNTRYMLKTKTSNCKTWLSQRENIFWVLESWLWVTEFKPWGIKGIKFIEWATALKEHMIIWVIMSLPSRVQEKFLLRRVITLERSWALAAGVGPWNNITCCKTWSSR